MGKYDVMRAIPHVLHGRAAPISLPEFADAVRATCPPRFPEAGGKQNRLRSIGLAVSGGVDSMALAYLCSGLRKVDPLFKISDNPLGQVRCIVVDHGLRDVSTREADQVRQALVEMGMTCVVLRINWARHFGPGVDPMLLSNLETMARMMRFRTIGAWAAHWSLASIFLAHHEDDQYETLLMRLMKGNGGRRLRGIRAVGGIPECEGMFGIYESGWFYDQERTMPYIRYKFPKKARTDLLGGLGGDVLTGVAAGVQHQANDVLVNPWVGHLADTETNDYSYLGGCRRSPDPSSQFAQLPIEDGGCRVYRPLLGFSKDRLIATCLANNIPWFEDHTNSDPTLTRRNAVRHMVNKFQLPAALQKPAVLALSARSTARSQAQDAEADRLLSRTRRREFQSRVGSIILQFPELAVSGFGRRPTPERRRRRITEKRIVAGLVIQKVSALIGPELNPPPLSSLQTAVSRLFPSLADGGQPAASQPLKGFSVASLVFTPIHLAPRAIKSTVDVNPQTWYVSRQPYTSYKPLPQCRSPYWASPKLESGSVQYEWSTCPPWQFYDGRYWIRLSHRLPHRVAVMPYLPQHAGHFRDSLSPSDQKRLKAVLRRLAPENVRLTLPAVYVEEYLDLDNPVPRPNYPRPEGDDVDTTEIRLEQPEGPAMPIDISKMRMLALPTLDIGLPGLADWLQAEVRYKKVDQSVLFGTGSSADNSCFVRAVPSKGRTRHSAERRRRQLRPKQFREGAAGP